MRWLFQAVYLVFLLMPSKAAHVVKRNKNLNVSNLLLNFALNNRSDAF